MRAYLDNGNTTPVDKRVVEAMKPYFTEKFGHPLFIYSEGKEANEAVENASEYIASTVGSRDGVVTFTSGVTEASDLALRGAVRARKNEGNHIITSEIENPSVLRVCEELEKRGFEVDYLGVDEKGFIDLEELKSLVRGETILVSIAHVSDEIGTIEPIKDIGEIIKDKNPSTYFHADIAASYGRVPFDMEKAKVDMVSLGAHLIHGPKGVGALIAGDKIELEPVNYGYLSLSKIRPGTENVPGIVGFKKAAEVSFEDFDSKVERIRSLRDKLISKIESTISKTVLHGARGDQRSPANVNFSFKNIEGESIMMHLDMRGISVATGSACATRKLEPSHVLTAIGVDPVVAHGAIRFTLSRMNTEEEIDYTLEVLPKVVKKLRKMSPMKS
ncbi:hypothetical protein AKJ45_02175 [candidate division MSBL1 archaeon SCGC-AAA261F19]|uniref:Aminotransferase class V domain-containing protein n=1 Tax=candidate division MSBL1 archaeon SCGC-AAA261F19 TaxID=1698275 RepID=A0A133V9T9_9EURY|nr:hypothetical protein AKJ45_02175 [candidate division MSBL1 archaeon SCGC-AAA261F19]